jgi:Spy/CpxP family protein refolding chaperone
MRKLMLMAAFALALPAAAQAQDGPRQMGGRAQMLNTVQWLLTSKDEFSATADQVAKIEAIAKKFDAETEKLRAEMDKVRDEMRAGAGDRETMMTKMRPIREELQKKDEAAVEEVLKILNADQQKSVKTLVETRKQEMQNRRRGGQRPNGIQ